MLDLLAHLVADVSAALLRLVLVDGVHNRLDHRALGALTEIERRRDDAGPVLAQGALGDSGINSVPEGSGEGVDDDVVDVTLFLEPCQHLLEDRSFIDRGAAAAGFDELSNKIRVECGPFA
nr:hypothetical protein [Kribbella turkmenica]